MPTLHMCPLPGFRVPGKFSRVSGKASIQIYLPLLLEPWSSVLGAVHMMSARKELLEVGRGNALLVSAWARFISTLLAPI